MRLVFVCSGNTCRSPLALVAWQLVARGNYGQSNCGQGDDGEQALERIEAVSAGLCASPGARAARHSQTVAREWGADLSSHRAQLFMPEHAKSDLIITMTHDQAAIVRAHFDVSEEQIRLLGTYTPRRERVAEAARFAPLWGDPEDPSTPTRPFETEILDPYGASLEAYQACAAQIRRSTFELARVLAGVNK
jgi:protein-tyrosine-phosphatase